MLIGLHGAVLQNIDACKQMANLLSTSYGPNGKLLFLK